MSVPNKHPVRQCIKSLQPASHILKSISFSLTWINCCSNLLKPHPSLKNQLKCHCLQSNKCSSFKHAGCFLSLLLRIFCILCLRQLFLCLTSPVKDHILKDKICLHVTAMLRTTPICPHRKPCTLNNVPSKNII